MAMPDNNLISTVIEGKTVPCTVIEGPVTQLTAYAILFIGLQPRQALHRKGERKKRLRRKKSENSGTESRKEENFALFQVSFCY